MTPDVAPPSIHRLGAALRGIASEHPSVERATLDFLDGFMTQNAALEAQIRRGQSWAHLGRPEIIRIR